MECIKNKSFLFWKWKSVEHNYKPYSVHKFMSSSDTFIVRYICETCGADYEEHFVKQDELLLNGIPMNEIKKITDFNYFYFGRVGEKI